MSPERGTTMKVDTSLFRASHWDEPNRTTFGVWCFTTQRDGGIEFEFSGYYTDAARAALAALPSVSTVYVMP
jgi:hypothetical protein